MSASPPDAQGSGPDRRIDALRRIVLDDPKDTVARFGLAQSLLAAGRPDEAIAEFEALLRIEPRYTAAYRGLGRAYEGTGRQDDAIRAYEAGVEIACDTGDLQTGKEMEVFLKRLRGAGA